MYPLPVAARTEDSDPCDHSRTWTRPDPYRYRRPLPDMLSAPLPAEPLPAEPLTSGPLTTAPPPAAGPLAAPLAEDLLPPTVSGTRPGVPGPAYPDSGPASWHLTWISSGPGSAATSKGCGLAPRPHRPGWRAAGTTAV